MRVPRPPGFRPLIPVGEATELEPVAVIERTDRHAWLAWDVATAVLDLDPLQRIDER